MRLGMPPGKARSMRAQSELSCRGAGLWSPRKLTQKSIDAAIAERVHNEVSQGIRCQTYDVCPGERAFRELNSGARGCSHDIAFFFPCLECALDLGQSSSGGLPKVVELVERDSYCGGSCLRGDDCLCRAEDEGRANDDPFCREPGHRHQRVLHQGDLHYNVIGHLRQLACLGVDVAR